MQNIRIKTQNLKNHFVIIYFCISSDTYWTAKQDNKYANGV